jgi:hypothetical protein
VSFIIGAIPYIKCHVRREYLFDRDQQQAGQFVPAVAYAVRCVRGSSLWFQCALGAPYGGAQFLLPIIALVHKPCAHPSGMQFVQPWDFFSSALSRMTDCCFQTLRSGRSCPTSRQALDRWTESFEPRAINT